jgi:hypothetical protein
MHCRVGYLENNSHICMINDVVPCRLRVGVCAC